MAENKKSFLLYADQLDIFEGLDDAEAGRLAKHIFRYVNDKNPVAPDKLTQIAFEPIKQQLKRDLDKWETILQKRSKAGKASAESKKHNSTKSTHVESVEHNSTKSTVSDNVNVNDNVIVNVNEISSIEETAFTKTHGKTISEFEQELLTSEIAKQERCMLHKLSPEKHDEYAKKFILKIKAEEHWQDRREALRYFSNTIPYFKKEEANQPKSLKPVGAPVEKGNRPTFEAAA